MAAAPKLFEMKPKSTIEPKSVVNLSSLKTNDRFRFMTGNKTKVWQVVEHVVVEGFDKQKKIMTRCLDDEMQPKRFDSGRSVMFLRNNSVQLLKSRLKKTQLIDY